MATPLAAAQGKQTHRAQRRGEAPALPHPAPATAPRLSSQASPAGPGQSSGPGCAPHLSPGQTLATTRWEVLQQYLELRTQNTSSPLLPTTRASPRPSLNPALGSGDHPVLADEGAPAEVEAGVVLEEDGEVSTDWTPAAPSRPTTPMCLQSQEESPLTCRDTCQGQEPGTASSPLTILDRPLSMGGMVGTPQTGSGSTG